MAGDGEIAGAESARRPPEEVCAVTNDPYRFLSTRLVRELITADAQAESARERPSEEASRLLVTVTEGLRQQGAALLSASCTEVVASWRMDSGDLGALMSAGEVGQTPLVQRCTRERRIFLMDAATQGVGPSVLGAIAPHWKGLALAPLCHRARCVGVLVLVSTEGALSPAVVRSLAPAFRLLALLVDPDRHGRGAPSESPAPTPASEARLDAVVDDLRAQLVQAHDRCRALEQRERESTAEVVPLAPMLPAAEDSALPVDLALGQADECDGPSEQAEATIAVLDHEDVQLGEIAEQAAAAIGADTLSLPADAQSADPISSVGAQASAFAPADEDSVSNMPLGLWHLEQNEATQTWAAELARRSGASFWTGQGERPATQKVLITVNLFDSSVEQAVQLATSLPDADTVVYGFDSEAEEGFELGSVGWISRPLEVETAIRRLTMGMESISRSVLLVSDQLREMAALRTALAETGIAASVACDSRQAADLLDIVGRPGVVLVDLALDSAQGLAWARELRSRAETREVALVFLLGKVIDPQTIAAQARRAGILTSYGSDDVRRLVNEALARQPGGGIG